MMMLCVKGISSIIFLINLRLSNISVKYPPKTFKTVDIIDCQSSIENVFISINSD